MSAPILSTVNSKAFLISGSPSTPFCWFICNAARLSALEYLTCISAVACVGQQIKNGIIFVSRMR